MTTRVWEDGKGFVTYDVVVVTGPGAPRTLLGEGHYGDSSMKAVVDHGPDLMVAEGYRERRRAQQRAARTGQPIPEALQSTRRTWELKEKCACGRWYRASKGRIRCTRCKESGRRMGRVPAREGSNSGLRQQAERQ